MSKKNKCWFVCYFTAPELDRIFVTAKSDDEAWRRSKQVLSSHYKAKPFTIHTVYKVSHTLQFNPFNPMPFISASYGMGGDGQTLPQSPQTHRPPKKEKPRNDVPSRKRR